MGKGREMDEMDTEYAYTSKRWGHPTLVESDGQVCYSCRQASGQKQVGHMGDAILIKIFQLTYHGDERINERTNFSRRMIENESRKRNQKATKRDGWMSRACKGVECSRYEPQQRQGTELDISMAQNRISRWHRMNPGPWWVGDGLGRKVLCPTAMGTGGKPTVSQRRKTSSRNNIESSDEEVD
uniref:Uncharacterized protein n=1 Tax=Gibberella zeae TaxID=5518 RepID=A0A4E9EE24_GIBZA